MTPEKFFDYLEGKLPPAEREDLERALISDPELQKEFVAARQIHRGLQRPADETAATTRAGSRGRQVAIAFAFLVALNVGIGLFFIFRANQPPPELGQAQTDALRQQLQSSLEKSAAAAFTPPTLGPETITITVRSGSLDKLAGAIIAAANQVGGSGTKALPVADGLRVLVLVPASSEVDFRKKLTAMGVPPSQATAATDALPNEPVHLEIFLAAPH